MTTKFSRYLSAYTELWEHDYKYVLHGLRAAVSLLPAFFLFVISGQLLFLWMGVCSFVWAVHIAFTEKLFWWRYCAVSIILSMLIVVGYLAKSHVVTFCLYSFLIAFFAFIFLYYKKIYLYTIVLYAIPQYGAFSALSFVDAWAHAGCAFLGFLSTYVSFRFLIKKNANVEISHMMNSGYFKLQKYMGRVKNYMYERRSENYKKLSQDRLVLFEFLQNLRVFLKQETSLLKPRPRAHAAFQERFIELCIWVCIRFRTFHLRQCANEDLERFFFLIDQCIDDLKRFDDPARVVERCQQESPYFLKDSVPLEIRDVYVPFYQNILLIEKELRPS